MKLHFLTPHPALSFGIHSWSLCHKPIMCLNGHSEIFSYKLSAGSSPWEGEQFRSFFQ